MLPLPSVECLLCILHNCGKDKGLRLFRCLHIMRSYGRETHASLGDYVISALVQVGSMDQAQEVFHKLLSPNEYSWNYLIVGFVKYGYFSSAFELYQKMQEHERVHTSGTAFVALLKACAQLTNMEMGFSIHIEISRMGFLERDVFVGSSLICMYSKSGCIINAQNVFNELTVRNPVTWNALISGYVENGYGDEALKCFKLMQEENFCPNAVTLVCCLKASIITGNTVKGLDIHIDILKKGFEMECLVGNCLIDMYTKGGLLREAQMLFDKLHVRTMIAGTTLLAGYAEHGVAKDAFRCFQQMQREGMPLDSSTYVCLLKACNTVAEMQKGFDIHTEISSKGFDSNPFIGTSLIDTYAKCGLLVEAHHVFNKLPCRDEISWSSLIAGLVENGYWEDVLNYVKKMENELLVVSTVAIVCCVKSCGMLKSIDRGREMHNIITQKGSLEKEFSIGCALMEMYFRCGFSSEAQFVFYEFPVSCITLWTTFIAGLVDHGFHEEALALFEWIQKEGMSTSGATYIWFLKASSKMENLKKAREMHLEIAKKGFSDRDIYVGTALIDTYAKCHSIEDAQAIFDHIQLHNLVSWTALIGGFTDCGRSEDAIKYFELMQCNGFSPVTLTTICCLKACNNARCIVNGQKIHAAVLRRGFESEIIVNHSLIDMYAKCGWLVEAYYLFKKQPQQTSIAWLALISGCVEHGSVDAALNLLEEMKYLDIFMDEDVLIYILKTSSSIGAKSKGQEIHIQCVTRGLENELLFGNCLVDMYGKCGLMAESQEVFDKLLVRDVVSWTALIAGYAQIGKCESILHHLDEMVINGMRPDSITFISIFNSCSHEGFVARGQVLFQCMSNYDIIPTIEHCICIVDLLGRAGQIEKALVLIEIMPYDPGILLWHIVLGACRKWGNVELGRHAFHQAICLDDKNAAAHVCMYNIYADAYMQEDIEDFKVETQM